MSRFPPTLRQMVLDHAREHLEDLARAARPSAIEHLETDRAIRALGGSKIRDSEPVAWEPGAGWTANGPTAPSAPPLVASHLPGIQGTPGSGTVRTISPSGPLLDDDLYRPGQTPTDPAAQIDLQFPHLPTSTSGSPLTLEAASSTEMQPAGNDSPSNAPLSPPSSVDAFPPLFALPPGSGSPSDSSSASAAAPGSFVARPQVRVSWLNVESAVQKAIHDLRPELVRAAKEQATGEVNRAAFASQAYFRTLIR